MDCNVGVMNALFPRSAGHCLRYHREDGKFVRQMSGWPNEPAPRRSRLRIASFALHAARGLVRDQATRRKAMFWGVIIAVLMLFIGATLLASVLNPREHP